MKSCLWYALGAIESSLFCPKQRPNMPTQSMSQHTKEKSLHGVTQQMLVSKPENLMSRASREMWPMPSSLIGQWGFIICKWLHINLIGILHLDIESCQRDLTCLTWLTLDVIRYYARLSEGNQLSLMHRALLLVLLSSQTLPTICNTHDSIHEVTLA